jgi:hypothetical protein
VSTGYPPAGNDPQLAPATVMGVGGGRTVEFCAGDRLHNEAETDNFKAKSAPIREIDTRFFQDLDGDGFFTDGVDNWIDGAQVTWTDTLGASNLKSSYLNLALDVHHEAHVEGVENGTHKIAIASQSGCSNVGQITVNGVLIGSGPQTVSVRVAASDKTLATQIWVACT